MRIQFLSKDMSCTQNSVDSAVRMRQLFLLFTEYWYMTMIFREEFRWITRKALTDYFNTMAQHMHRETDETAKN